MKKVVVLVATCLLLMISANAQTGSSSLRGIVTDPQGNAVAGATVTLSNPERNFNRSQTTNGDGAYVFTGIPPGAYQVEVEMKGFKKALLSNVKALVDTPTDLDVQLEVGSVNETVNITSGSEAPLNTTDATLGNTFESRRISELPLNARNVVGLLSLQPGVTRGGAVNGGRADQANITLDGVDVNEQQRGIDVVTDQAFASVLRVTPDSVQEFRVVTTNPNAEQGRSSGAQVSLVTKSGTNDWHGLLYEYHRNTVTTANDYFNNAANVPRPPLLRNIFGGTVGGPIKRDKAFFFFSYEGFREATATTVVRTVPLADSIGNGIVRYKTASGASDATCPAGTPSGYRCLTLAQIGAFYQAANGVNPIGGTAALDQLKAAANKYRSNDTTTGDLINTGGFRFNAITPTTYDTYTSKFDFNLTNRQTMFVRLNYQNDKVGLAPTYPDQVAPTIWNHPTGIAIGHTWTLTNHLVNNFKYGRTRLAFSQLGDSAESQVSFRFVFSPTPTRTLERVTPVDNFVDDISWLHGKHNYQFGTNIRLISNHRNSFDSSYDFFQTNPSGYNASGAVLTSAGADATGAAIFPDVASSSVGPLRNALSAVIGRFSGYSANLLYDVDGKLLPFGTSSDRTFATQEYDLYFQDSWRMTQNFTLSYGVRWSTSTPVYEKNGFEIVPTVPLGGYFNSRVQGAEQGVPFTVPISFDKGGKFYGKPGFYPQDWNNFAPSISAAWSPSFGNNWFGRLIGRDNQSVIRGGFRMTYDRIGSQLAVNFDGANRLGYLTTLSIPVNTYNVSTALAPLYTGGIPDARVLPGIVGSFANQLSFPRTQPSDQAQRIETSLDSALTTPYNYNFNLSYGREIGKGLSFEVSYVGRFARNLLAQRDIMHLNNFKDPKSGMTWYQAINQLIDYRLAGVPVTSVQPIAWFQNVTPGLAGTFSVLGVPTALTATQRAYQRIAMPSVGGSNVTDYTFRQLQWDDPPISILRDIFFHPQYGALNTWGTFAYSNYNSLQFSMRQRLRKDVTFDFNYTYGHSLDNASALQSAGNFSSGAFIFNPLDPDGNYADSDFDFRHIVNANWLVGLPFGRGKTFFHDANKVVNGILGGWQMTGIFRWNSGAPTGSGTRPFGFQRWPTNWNLSSGMVRVRPVTTTTAEVNGNPNIFADPLAALLSYRDARPGEAGDRNVLRLPGYFALDAGLYKSFRIGERQTITFRWEVYNVTNTQKFTSPGGFAVSAVDPFLQGQFGLPAITTAPSDFGKFTATQTPLGENKAGRVMQFALRWSF
ncbi:MAG TPA: carboxypeptidase-like regulatory domain-containing protein [Pyrinomonadaceae bacterium]|jgi:carboxypeptidase family protein|nr:carboxypeptidase-like regulatory domain-containing protein [Pyrinomonadaceae bacterium]